MADKRLCPTCHSVIATNPLSIRVQGQQQASTETPVKSVSDAIPQWTRDPILTTPSTNGNEFLGQEKLIDLVLTEIQNARRQEEIEVGIPKALQTDFSEISLQHFKDVHLIELRESVEKILNTTGLTLFDYFNFDAEGNQVDPGPSDKEKSEWSYVERGSQYVHKDGSVSGIFKLPDGTAQKSPSVPINTKMNSIVLEDIRHPILMGWREYWSVSFPSTIFQLPSNFNSEFSNHQSGIGHRVDPHHPDREYGFSYTRDTELKEIRPETIVLYNSSLEPIGEVHPTAIFPTGFDIYPSDAGNRYKDKNNLEVYPKLVPESDPPVYIPSRTWITRALISNEKGTTVSAFNVCSSEGIAENSVKIEDSTVPQVLLKKPNAKQINIKLNCHSSLNSTGDADYAVPMACRAISYVNIHHIWSYFSKDFPHSQPLDRKLGFPINYNYSTTADKVIKINKNTRLKFLLELQTIGDNPAFFFNSTNIPITEDLSLENQAVTNGRSSQGLITTVEDFRFPEEDTQGLHDGWDTATGIEGKALSSEFFSSGTNSLTDFPFIGYNILNGSLVSLACVLVLYIPTWHRGIFIDFRFHEPPTPMYYTNNYQTVTAPFGGQAFTFQRMGANTHFEDRLVTVYIGGNLNDIHNFNVNIDDLLSAWKLTNRRNNTNNGNAGLVNFPYISHKIEDADHNIVENPNGTEVQLVRMAFHVGARSHAFNTLNSIKNIQVNAIINSIRLENTPGGIL